MKRTFLGILGILAVLAFIGCDGSPATYAVGEKGPGGVGIVFYVEDGGKTGLVAANADLPALYSWKTENTVTAGTFGTAIGTGRANTELMVVDAATAALHPAANACVNYSVSGYDDWYMPSQDEVAALDALVLIGTGGQSQYWSSTQGTVNTSAAFNLGTITKAWSEQNKSGPSSARGVRPVRSFKM